MQLGFDFTIAPPPDVDTGPHRRRGDAGPVFVRHRRARRYILRVLDDGTVRVTLPRWGSKQEARAFVERCGDWIARQLLKRQARGPVTMPDQVRLRERAAAELP